MWICLWKHPVFAPKISTGVKTHSSCFYSSDDARAWYCIKPGLRYYSFGIFSTYLHIYNTQGVKARQTKDRWKAFWDFFSTLLVWFWTASIDDQSKNRPFAWPDFNFNVHFISIKNILICSLQFKRGWSLNLGPTICWIEFQTESKSGSFFKSAEISHVPPAASFECSQDRKHGRG